MVGQPRTLTLFAIPGSGTEDVVVGADGTVFTGTADGTIHALTPATGAVRAVARTGGRPLGIELFGEGRLLVCDAVRGLLAVGIEDGTVEVLTAEIDGVPMRFLNNATVLPDRTIFFTDSSAVHPLVDWKGEVVEDTCSGRLLRRSPAGAVSVVLDGVRFANGVTAAADASYVVVAELNARRLLRHWLTGDRAGETEPFVEDLPGYPDNIASGSDGLIWVTIASPVDPLVERLAQAPMWLRRGVTKIPDALQPKPKQTVRVQAYDDAGALVHDLDVPRDQRGPGYHMVTGVREHEGRVWMGSLLEPAVAVLDL